MQKGEHYPENILFFFDGKPAELALYEAFSAQMEAKFPEASVRVQKTQISFYGKHLFAAASIPLRRKKGWPKTCLMVSPRLPIRLDSPRVAAAVEPCPGRWTNHILLEKASEVDERLGKMLDFAWQFSQEKV